MRDSQALTLTEVEIMIFVPAGMGYCFYLITTLDVETMKYDNKTMNGHVQAVTSWPNKMLLWPLLPNEFVEVFLCHICTKNFHIFMVMA